MAAKRKKNKIKTITVRIEPAVKEAAERAAEYERRSVTNLIEVLILNFCKEKGIEVNDIQQLRGK